MKESKLELVNPVVTELKPLDFVKTPKGNFAIVTEVTDNRDCSITFIGPQGMEHNAWWPFDRLQYLGNMPDLLAKTMKHPFSSNKANHFER